MGSLQSTRAVLCEFALLWLSSCTLLYPAGPETRKFACANETATENAVKLCFEDGSAGSDQKVSGTCGGRGATLATCDIGTAVACATSTRDLYADFLLCRENLQLTAGASIVSLASAAAAVATAGSSVAAVSLGAPAGGFLGLDYAMYNKAKTKAYADATVQLQCVIRQSESLPAAWKDIEGKFLAYDTAAKALELCSPAPGQQAQFDLLSAQHKVAVKQEGWTRTQLERLGPEIAATVQTIDVTAFAASQSGVPDAAQIEKGVQAVSVSMPKISSTASIPECSEALLATDQAAVAFRQSLARLQLPEAGFSDCMALKAYAPTATSPSSTVSSKPSSSATAAASDDASSPSAAAASSSTISQKPTKIAFQILPSDNQLIDTSKGDGTTTIKVVGGTAPYYAVALTKNVAIVHATQTDTFVSYQVAVPKGESGRVLMADQGGSWEVVNVTAK